MKTCLGGDTGGLNSRREALQTTVTGNADRFAADLANVVADVRATRALSLRAMAGELTARGIMTRRGGRLQVSNVKGLPERLEQERHSILLLTTCGVFFRESWRV